MARVRCDLPNASENINGVAFMPAVDGSHVISEDVADEIAARFCSIPGYSLADESVPSQTDADTHNPDAPNPDAPPVVDPAVKPAGKRAAKAAATTEEVEK